MREGPSHLQSGQARCLCSRVQRRPTPRLIPARGSHLRPVRTTTHVLTLPKARRSPYPQIMATEQLVDSHLRQLEDAIRYVESTALLIRNALASAASADALRTTIEHRVAALLNAVDDQLVALEQIGCDITELRIQAHGSRRRRPR